MYTYLSLSSWKLPFPITNSCSTHISKSLATLIFTWYPIHSSLYSGTPLANSFQNSSRSFSARPVCTNKRPTFPTHPNPYPHSLEDTSFHSTTLFTIHSLNNSATPSSRSSPFNPRHYLSPHTTPILRFLRSSSHTKPIHPSPSYQTYIQSHTFCSLLYYNHSHSKTPQAQLVFGEKLISPQLPLFHVVSEEFQYKGGDSPRPVPFTTHREYIGTILFWGRWC